MIALINVFIYMLKNVERNTIQSDLSLLDMAAGHFARMELITAYQLSFPFAREVASIARRSISSINEPLDWSTATLGNLTEHDLNGLDWSFFEAVRSLDPWRDSLRELM